MPADLATLSALKARVEAATGPDRDLDGALMAALDPPYGRGWDEPFSYFCRYNADDQGLFKPHAATLAALGAQVPAYTESLDAALELKGNALPGAMWAVGNMEAGAFCRLVYPIEGKGWGLSESVEAEGGAKSEPLAILSALLAAKIAQLEVDHAR